MRDLKRDKLRMKLSMKHPTLLFILFLSIRLLSLFTFSIIIVQPNLPQTDTIGIKNSVRFWEVKNVEFVRGCDHDCVR